MILPFMHNYYYWFLSDSRIGVYESAVNSVESSMYAAWHSHNYRVSILV